MTIDPIFAGEYNKEITFAATAEEFTSAIENAQDGDVIRPTADMSLAESGNVTINNDITIDVPEGVTVTTARTNNQANIIVAAGKTLNLTGNGTLSGDNRIVDTNGTLNVDGPTFNTTTENRGSVITVNPGGNLLFKSGTVNSPYMAFYLNGDATIEGGTFNLTSKNSNAGYAYGIQANEGSNLVINGGDFTGIQGIVASIFGGEVTINGGFFRTYNSQDHRDGFYCVYAANGGIATINGGYFYGANDWSGNVTEGLSCIVSSDNDAAGQTLGILKISGGYFSGKPYEKVTNGATTVVSPLTGTYVPCSVEKNGYTFTWTVGQ